MANLLHFNQLNKNDVLLAGGKGASLGEMFQAGIPVPSGFVITTDVHKEIRSGIKKIKEFQQEIFKFFDDLGVERVAVRSSATVEDSPSFSWAGQLESYLNITKDKLLESIEMCWNSARSQRALDYAEGQNISIDKLLVAVIVQVMVDSEVSGIAFSVNPLTKNTDEIMIEAGRGLGELIVQGMITPNNFVVNKTTLEITLKNISEQKVMLIYHKGKTVEMPVAETLKNTPVLDDDKLQDLARLVIKIEEHYGTPQDIEWSFVDGKFYIVQSRPITTL